MGRPASKLLGMKFGKLTVVARSGTDKWSSSLWICNCDCGASKIVARRDLKARHTISCGCVGALGPIKHGSASRKRGRSPTYIAWMNMIQRCTNPKRHDWKRYGAIGVSVCDRWRSFENFLADMGETAPNLSLDRYPDPSGNYEPSNCRWATTLEQRHNRRA